MQDKQFTILESLLEVADTKQTIEEFVKAFEKVLELFAQMKADMESEMDAMRAAMQVAVEKSSSAIAQNASKDIEKAVETLKKSMTSHGKEMALYEKKMDAMYSAHEKMMQICEEKLLDLKDGKDADEEKIVRDVLSKIPKETSDTAEQVVDKVNSAGGKIKRERVEGFDDYEDIKRQAKFASSRSIPPGPVGFRGAARFSFTGNGSTTEFRLPKTPALGGLALWMYYNGAWLVPDTDFTLAGNLVTTQFVAGENTFIRGVMMW